VVNVQVMSSDRLLPALSSMPVVRNTVYVEALFKGISGVIVAVDVPAS